MLASGFDTNSPPKRPRKEPTLIVVSAIMSVLCLAAQLLVGWVEEGRFTLHPGGHLSVVLFEFWIVTIVIILIALLYDREHLRWALLSFAVAIICLAILVSPW
jgi:hypothetical protein